MDACNTALAALPPTSSHREVPVIVIREAAYESYDPCCLRLLDQLMTLRKEGRWDTINQERKAALTCMAQVLTSSCALLESNQVPIDGVIRLLQHIMRPQQNDLQLWASQLLLSKGISVEDLQKKFQAHSAVSELLKLLQPGSVIAAAPTPNAFSTPSLDGLAFPKSSPSSSSSSSLPPSSSNQSPPLIFPGPHELQLLLQHQQQLLGPMGLKPSNHSNPNPPSSGTTHQARSSLHSPPDPKSPGLSQERDWDWDKSGNGDGSGTSGANGGVRLPANHKSKGAAATMKKKGGSQGLAKSNPLTSHGSRVASGGGGGGGKGLSSQKSRKERYQDVESFWKSTSVEQRRELLRVPLSSLLHSVRVDHGAEVTEEVCEGLVLLKEQGDGAARYWACPVCDQRFGSGKDFSRHVEAVHESLALSHDKHVICCNCRMEAVGVYYYASSSETSQVQQGSQSQHQHKKRRTLNGYSMCLRCYVNDCRMGQ